MRIANSWSRLTSPSSARLPPSLQEIQAEAFIGCVALCSIALPDKLRYIAHRAFGECSQLSRLHYRRLQCGLLGGARMLLTMHLSRATGLQPHGGSTTYPQMGVIALYRQATIPDCITLNRCM